MCWRWKVLLNALDSLWVDLMPTMTLCHPYYYRRMRTITGTLLSCLVCLIFPRSAIAGADTGMETTKGENTPNSALTENAPGRPDNLLGTTVNAHAGSSNSKLIPESPQLATSPRSAKATITIVRPANDPQFIYQPSSDEARKTSLPIYVWGPRTAKPKGAVILVHGLFQHGECFATLGRHLAENGFLALSIDQRGHGVWHFKHKSNQPGYYVDYSQTMKDVKALATVLHDEHSTMPIFLLGESAGAAVVARCAARSPRLFDGVIMCAFGTEPRSIRWRWMLEDVAWNALRWDHEIGMERYVKRFSSDDDRIVQENLADPLCRPGVSLKELVDTGDFIRKTKKIARKLGPNMPVLLVEGEDDQVFNPKSSGRFIEHVRSKLKQFVLIPHCGHVLVGTNFIKPFVMASIDSFLTKYVSPGQLTKEDLLASK